MSSEEGLGVWLSILDDVREMAKEQKKDITWGAVLKSYCVSQAGAEVWAMSIKPCPTCGCYSPIFELGVCETCYHMGSQPKAAVHAPQKPQLQVITPAPLMAFLGDLANLGPALVRTLNHRPQQLRELREMNPGLRTLLLQMREGIDATLRDLDPPVRPAPPVRRPSSDPVPPAPKPTPNLTTHK